MRTTLIVLQAIALSLFAVLGAQGDTADAAKCPVNTAIADRNCGD
ncbi:hypothetical protein AAFO92_04460 [Roseovarius sp. CAU 1744]